MGSAADDAAARCDLPPRVCDLSPLVACRRRGRASESAKCLPRGASRRGLRYTVAYVESMPARAKHLIGAHGLFWERDAIDWDAPRGRTFQLLGYRHERVPKVQVCDFRRSRGVYLLYNEYGPTYVGQAQGSTDGLGYRLRAHHRDGFKDWTRFCWFSFDNVQPSTDYPGWCDVLREDTVRSVGVESAINDLEALMIVAFGLKSQNQMSLTGSGLKWKQLTRDECLPGGVGRKVHPAWIKMKTLRDALDLET